MSDKLGQELYPKEITMDLIKAEKVDNIKFKNLPEGYTTEAYKTDIGHYEIMLIKKGK